MGEQQGAVLDAVPEVEAADAEQTARRRGRIGRRGAVVIAVAVTLVAAGGIWGGVAWAEQRAHDEALALATDARADAVEAVVGQRSVLEELGADADAAITLRDAVAAKVLPHTGLLGGAEAVAPVVAAHEDLALALAELFGTEAPGADAELGIRPFPAPAPIDKAAPTEALRELTEGFGADAAAAAESRGELEEESGRIGEVNGALGEALANLAGTIGGVNDALLAARTLASGDSRSAAVAAAEALTAAETPAELPPLFAGYASAAAAVIAAHDAEAARIAAEQAAAEAAKRARGGSPRAGGGGGGAGGGGGSVTSASEQRGVLTETNAHRGANGVGALVWNGTLASRSCSFAAELAARNGDLYHSGWSSGFRAWAENVAYGYGSASGVVNGWMNSSGHRANILNGTYTMMGACSSTSSTGRVYWVQQFGA
ncbi:CAP domain-containing protein [Protaetiibacter sp. SSC-01]|uniref:CAP domain-containing protein n=1 Tax=Protaetiibacter sp. SSC-01 TaxID=2759943 RepID=UPI001656EA37|nr:CAP domain-containing protein [Protaetiibacter sp. SSC-01]QNO36442.1 CAP domain-containing protein [Protaetiibacter sp. SSC-01]